MSKIGEIRGIIAVSIKEGKNLGKLKRIFIDRQKHVLWGVTLATGTFFGEEFLLTVDKIEKLGEDFLLIQDSKGLPHFDSRHSSEQLSPTVIALNDMIGFDVHTSDGRYVGNLLDMEVDTRTWKLTGLILSGCKLVQGITEDTVFGEDVIILPEGVIIAENEQEHGKGWGGIFSKTVGKEHFSDVSSAIERVAGKNAEGRDKNLPPEKIAEIKSGITNGENKSGTDENSKK